MASDTLRSSLFARAEKLRNQLEYLMTSRRDFGTITRVYEEYREVLLQLDQPDDDTDMDIDGRD